VSVFGPLMSDLSRAIELCFLCLDSWDVRHWGSQPVGMIVVLEDVGEVS
jgi:hypothetical protein